MYNKNILNEKRFSDIEINMLDKDLEKEGMEIKEKTVYTKKDLKPENRLKLSDESIEKASKESKKIADLIS